MPETPLRTPRAKRVARACDYCRRKRDRDRGRRATTVTASSRASEPDVNPQADAVIQVAVSAPPTVADEPSVDPNLDATIPPQCSLEDDLAAASNWAPDPSYSHDNDNMTQDFGYVLRQLGIGVSSAFWEMERLMLPHLPDMAAPTMSTLGHPNGPGEPNRALSSHSPLGTGQACTSYFASPPRSTTTSVNGKVSSIRSLTKRDEGVESLERSVPLGVFIRKDETVANYIDAFESQPTLFSSSSMGFLIEAGPHVDEVGLTSLFDVASQQLPSREGALESINAYFKNLHEFYPIVDEESFRARTETLYSSDRSGFGVLDYSLFLLVVSIGRLSINHKSDGTGSDDGLAERTYQKAWSMVHDSMAKPYIDLPASQLRLRSRLWWIAFSFDASLSLSQGRPPGVMDATFDEDTMLAEPEVGTNISFPTLSQIYSWSYQLNQIQSRFCNIMHSKDTILFRLDAILKVDSDLMLCGLRTQEQGMRRRSPPVFVPVSAYASTARGLSGAGDLFGEKVFVISFQTTNYKAAMAVLYRNICKNPLHLSARADLEHLRACKLHLERDTPNDVIGPVLKTLFANMVVSAHDLVWRSSSTAMETMGTP
ncbi:hypothetical protein SAPIO_CDS2530 [Scedosporium apiospermum]|uniref:Transcription factor domain-containing protein n=1 Tax=Pseudallescheria apiosperma TaxID=563466 RepID=A0A084GCN8_PSEDA|nr:uncharacterized protein SAPIO_CDS2530 [Scedosporium apiospermum]KEZ45100.1 hypothetical protein SAPIO_CDS2530 [Scedosporium apiospermum]